MSRGRQSLCESPKIASSRSRLSIDGPTNSQRYRAATVKKRKLTRLLTRTRRQAGQSLIESALILAAFMGLLVGMGSIGESLFVRQTLADRTRMAARWGALNNYDPAAIRRVVLFGTAESAQGSAFFGLTPDAVDVSNPGCPGPACRVSVAIPEHGIRSVEPMESIIPPSPASKP